MYVGDEERKWKKFIPPSRQNLSEGGGTVNFGFSRVNSPSDVNYFYSICYLFNYLMPWTLFLILWNYFNLILQIAVMLIHLQGKQFDIYRGYNLKDGLFLGTLFFELHYNGKQWQHGTHPFGLFHAIFLEILKKKKQKISQKCLLLKKIFFLK